MLNNHNVFVYNVGDERQGEIKEITAFFGEKITFILEEDLLNVEPHIIRKKTVEELLDMFKKYFGNLDNLKQIGFLRNFDFRFSQIFGCLPMDKFVTLHLMAKDFVEEYAGIEAVY